MVEASDLMLKRKSVLEEWLLAFPSNLLCKIIFNVDHKVINSLIDYKAPAFLEIFNTFLFNSRKWLAYQLSVNGQNFTQYYWYKEVNLMQV